MSLKRNIEDIKGEGSFIEACTNGTAEDVTPYIFDVSPNIVHGSQMMTPLIAACQNTKWEEAEKIVAVLLNLGAFYNVCAAHGSTALHYSAQYSSLNVVTMLLERGHFVDPRNHNGKTPLMYASHRTDDEGLKIVSRLLKNGANISIQNNCLETALAFACRHSTLEMVMLLGPRKHSVINMGDKKGATPLMHACLNVYHGEEIIPYLISAGADTSTKTKGNSNALSFACTKNATLLRTIRAFIGPMTGEEITLYVDYSLRHCPNDTLGVVQELGLVNSRYLRLAVEKKLCHSSIWAILRSCSPRLDGSQNDYYTVLRELAPNDARLWSMVTSATSGGRHPITGDTTLHAAVRTGHADCVAAVLRHMPNPFLRNIARETPFDVAVGLSKWVERQKIIFGLKLYSQWRPSYVCADWYGPFFCRRAKAFLLVAKRLKVFPRDLVLLILKHLADLEYV